MTENKPLKENMRVFVSMVSSVPDESGFTSDDVRSAVELLKEKIRSSEGEQYCKLDYYQKVTLCDIIDICFPVFKDKERIVTTPESGMDWAKPDKEVREK